MPVGRENESRVTELEQGWEIVMLLTLSDDFGSRKGCYYSIMLLFHLPDSRIRGFVWSLKKLEKTHTSPSKTFSNLGDRLRLNHVQKISLTKPVGAWDSAYWIHLLRCENFDAHVYFCWEDEIFCSDPVRRWLNLFLIAHLNLIPDI